VPGYGELLESVERWRRFPGRERLDHGYALTFDDGPDRDATPAVLEALAACGVPATFFLVGEQLQLNSELGKEIVTAGHAVGLHGFDHVGHDALPDPRDDLVRGLDAIESACGVRPRTFRPPYGRFSEASYAACLELGLEPLYWSGWGMDWEPLPPERIAELVSRDLEPGAIVLLHDSPRYAHRPSAAPTAEAIPAIVETARARGLEPRVLSSS
jgi:peptidoglycan-N-acetylglucosamine deacetylase